MTPLRILFVKESQSWPRSSGHDVHGYNMMKALAARGHAVSLAAVVSPSPEALDGLPLKAVHTLDAMTTARQPLPLSALQRRFADYFGVRDGLGHALANVLDREPADVIVVVARHLLPLFAAVPGPVRVWYPADDPAWHHLTRFKPRDRKTWGELKQAAVNALYERAYRSLYDRAWVVSPGDRAAVRLFAGCGQVDLIPNGVDADHYAPGPASDLPASAVFWGRLDFGPNLDALEWFLAAVWPAVRTATPAARLSVFGFNPTPRVRRLAETPGVELHPDLPDIRAEVRRRGVVVLPFVSGGGIKNKLLEAASMGLPVVCTPWALSGTKGRPAVAVARTPAEWAAALARLWADAGGRARLGAAARRWVVGNHTWEAAAATAEAGVVRSLAQTGDL